MQKLGKESFKREKEKLKLSKSNNEVIQNYVKVKQTKREMRFSGRKNERYKKEINQNKKLEKKTRQKNKKREPGGSTTKRK